MAATTRRRGAQLEEAILDAGWAQLKEHGYAGFTFEAIAEKAQTGKTALYRRWPDKESLLVAVLRHAEFQQPVDIPDTGSLRDDVLEFMRSANRWGDNAAAVLSTMLGAYFEEGVSTPAELRTELLSDRSSGMPVIVQHAVERGELAAPLSPQLMALPFDLVRHEMIMNLGRVPEQKIIDIIDNVFMPLVMKQS